MLCPPNKQPFRFLCIVEKHSASERHPENAVSPPLQRPCATLCCARYPHRESYCLTAAEPNLRDYVPPPAGMPPTHGNPSTGRRLDNDNDNNSDNIRCGRRRHFRVPGRGRRRGHDPASVGLLGSAPVDLQAALRARRGPPERQRVRVQRGALVRPVRRRGSV